jgi:hypothetical protein
MQPACFSKEERAGFFLFAPKDNSMADQKKFEVSKVTTTDGRAFYTRETDRAKLIALPKVKRIEDAWMTEEEFNAIPASQDAEAFFKGEAKAARESE